MTTEHGLCQVLKTFCFSLLQVSCSAIRYGDVVAARRALRVGPQVAVSADVLVSPPADPFASKQKKGRRTRRRPLTETTTLARAVDAELHRRLAGLVGTHVGRGRVVVEVRDAHTFAGARRARRELVLAAQGDAVAARKGRRGSHAVCLGACAGIYGAVVQVVVRVVA